MHILLVEELSPFRDLELSQLKTGAELSGHQVEIVDFEEKID
jgi:hypothetical protein